MDTAAHITVPYAEAYEEFLILRGLGKKTRMSYTNALKRFLLWAENENIEPQNISYNDTIAFISHCRQRGNKQRTVQIMLTSVNNFYEFLMSRKEMAENPCSGIDVRGIKRRILYEIFTPAELEDIYKKFCSNPGGKNGSTGVGTTLVHQRNKIILGLIIYQALRTEELARLTVKDVKLSEGKIFITGGKRSDERTLELQAHQLYDLMNYINETRKLILALTGKQSEHLFVTLGHSEYFRNIMDKIIKKLIQQNSRIKDIKQLRASVITNWLSSHNIRKVQHMAGHRYVSSTENYQANNMDELKEDISRYHPDL